MKYRANYQFSKTKSSVFLTSKNDHKKFFSHLNHCSLKQLMTFVVSYSNKTPLLSKENFVYFIIAPCHNSIFSDKEWRNLFSK